MNADILKGQWKEIKGEVKQKWGKLTDDDLTQIEGKEEQLLGLLQKRYGYAKEKAEEEYKGFISRYGKPPLGEKIKWDMIKFDRPQLNTSEFTWPDWENFPLKGGDKMELTKVEKDRLAALKAKKDLTPAEKAELDALKAKELK